MAMPAGLSIELWYDSLGDLYDALRKMEFRARSLRVDGVDRVLQ